MDLPFPPFLPLNLFQLPTVLFLLFVRQARHYMIKWQEILSKNGLGWKDEYCPARHSLIATLPDLKMYLDAVHIRFCLVKPFQENGNYPLVEARELLPSFDNAMFEYNNLPGFSMVAFERQLNFFEESFQYDLLYPAVGDGTSCPLEKQVSSQNIQAFTARLPRMHQDVFRSQFAKQEIALLDSYPSLMPYLLNMDRAHVMSHDPSGKFHLCGIFASFQNDLDSVLKRFGQHIGKFRPGDGELYARNRMFVYQFLMELYGFPIVSERRTSAAMFARRLNKRGEKFLLRVLGQTDRTITTYTSDGSGHHFPKIEKIALVAVDPDQTEAIEAIDREGFFLDRERRAIILRINYRQHRYDINNVRQDRALSVETQEIIHPLTGRILSGLNIIRDNTNMYLRLNDIVHGEYTGRIVYRRTEIIDSTETDEKRLKVLFYWLSKHQRRMIDYSDDFFDKVNKILTGYLYSPAKDEAFESLRDLHHDVCARLGYIQQARRVRILEELRQRIYHGEHIPYRKMIQIALELANNLKFEIVNFFPDLVSKSIACLDHILSDRYLIRNYIQYSEGRQLTAAGQEIRKGYGALAAAADEFRFALKSRSTHTAPNQKTS